MVLAYLGHLSSLGPFMSPLERKAKTSSLNWLLLRLLISTAYYRFRLLIPSSNMFRMMTCKQRLLLLNHNMHFLTSFMLGFAKFALTALLTWKRSWRLIRLNGLVLGYTPFLFRMLVLLCLFWSIVSFTVPHWSWSSELHWSLSLLHYRLFWHFWLSRIIVSWPGPSYFSSQCFSGLPLFSGSTGRPWESQYMVRGIYQLIFYLVRSWFVCWCDDCESFYRHRQENSRPRFFLAVGSHPQTSALCRSM